MPDNQALEKYDEQFYAEQINGSLRSASVVVPHILSMFPEINSVVDVGCGVGTWLSVFKAKGVGSVQGFDGGSPDASSLLIAVDEYTKADFTRNFTTDTRADLAMSLEVAEHLDNSHAEHFVDCLTEVSDLIFFSAAIPGQGGTHHVNERWPSYWEDLFQARGYAFYDVLRNSHWHDQRVDWWYRQNMFIIIKADRSDLAAKVESAMHRAQQLPRDCVHPDMYLHAKHSRNQLHRQLQEARHRADVLQSEIDSLLSSNSWRLMSAPRAVLSAFKKLKP